jgi:hypothetical protein
MWLAPTSSCRTHMNELKLSQDCAGGYAPHAHSELGHKITLPMHSKFCANSGCEKAVGAVRATDLGKGPFLIPDGIGRRG